VAPTQPFDVGVIRYTTSMGEVVVLIRASLIELVVLTTAPFEIPVTAALLQLNVVPGTSAVMVYAWATALQILAVPALVTLGN
jgi:hypothetical protein